MKFENVTASEVIVPRQEIQGVFKNPSEENSKISKISITKNDAAVTLRITTSAGVAECSFETGLGVTNIAWDREIVVVMVRKFHQGGSSPRLLAVCSVKVNKPKIYYIDAISKEKFFTICDIIEVRGDTIRVEAALGSREYKYIFGDVKIDSLSHSDSVP